MNEKFNLIEGVFNAQDARDILLSLIHEKIKFHDLKSLSSEIKTGKKNQDSLIKVEELRQTKTELVAFINIEGKGLSTFSIKSFIEIERIKT